MFDTNKLPIFITMKDNAIKAKTTLSIFILLFIGSHYCYSQKHSISQKEIDSLIVVLKRKDAYADLGSKQLLDLSYTVYTQSKKIKYSKGILDAISKMTEIYMNEQNYETALRIISEGRVLAEKNHDQYNLARLNTTEGMIYTELGYTKRSRKLLKEALNQIGKINNIENPVLKAAVYRSMSRNIMKEGQSGENDSVLMYLHMGYDESKKINHNFYLRKNYLASFAMDLSYKYFSKRDIKNTEKYLVQFAKEMQVQKDSSDFIYYYTLKGNIENEKKNFKKALNNFEKSDHLAKKSKIYPLALKEIYSGKAKSYLGLKDYKKQAFYSEKAQKISDSILILEKKVLNNIISRTGSFKNTDNQTNTTKSLIIILILSISITFFVLYTFYIKKKKYHKTPESFTDSEKSTEENISLYKKDSSTENLTGLKLLVQNKDQSFHLKFSEAFPTFNSRLLQINSHLTYSDLEYCALIRLNLDNKIIADYKNISPNSVISKKYRLRKKLNISKDENMYIWMLNLK